MTTATSVSTSPADFSDAGGVAARQGFRYQDHIAASFLVDMIRDETLLEVQCETHDDIVLVWEKGGTRKYEYVQVKTTEDDKKYSKTEIYERDSKKPYTSLIEKSLLCDKGHCTAPLFRIVSRRDVATSLSLLTLSSARRLTTPGFDTLRDAIFKKYKATISDGGKNLSYWTENVFWHVAGTQTAVVDNNLTKLQRQADAEGANPPWQLVQDGYFELVSKADEAAVISKKDDPGRKIITRSQILIWWETFLSKTQSYAHRNAKPYAVGGSEFLIEFVDIKEETLKRHLSGFEAKFEGDRWRTQELADHLVDYLPELALKPSELSQVPPSGMRGIIKKAIQKINRSTHMVEYMQLLGDTLLHVILRQKLKSEPTACRIFERGHGGKITFSNAHIVRREHDELWLGKSKLVEGDNFQTICTSMLTDLSEHIKNTFLQAEKEVILALREPRHLRFNGIDELLSSKMPVSDLMKVTWFSLLIAYDSKAILNGNEDYQGRILDEAKERYQDIKSKMDASLSSTKIAVFLIPLDSVTLLYDHFKNILTKT